MGREKSDPLFQSFSWNVPPRAPLSPVLERFREFLEGVRYKPGWKFQFQPFNGGQAEVTITGSVRDTRQPGNPRTEVFLHKRVDAGQIEKLELRGLQELVRTWLLEFEQHETDEWLVIDGVRPFDPHAMEMKLSPLGLLDPLDRGAAAQKLFDRLSFDAFKFAETYLKSFPISAKRKKRCR